MRSKRAYEAREVAADKHLPKQCGRICQLHRQMLAEISKKCHGDRQCIRLEQERLSVKIAELAAPKTS